MTFLYLGISSYCVLWLTNNRSNVGLLFHRWIFSSALANIVEEPVFSLSPSPLSCFSQKLGQYQENQIVRQEIRARARSKSSHPSAASGVSVNVTSASRRR